MTSFPAPPSGLIDGPVHHFAVRAYFEYVFGPFSSSTILVVVVAGFGYLGARTLAGAPTGIGLPNRAVQERFVQ